MSNLLAKDIGLPDGYNAFRFPGGIFRIEAPGGEATHVEMPYGEIRHEDARAIILRAVEEGEQR